ncbi:hypothetical protein MPER_00917, partial [Moniliophthora perniciosa FA553]
MRWVALFGGLSLLLSAQDAFAVKSHDFKTCSQSGFCRMSRALSSRAKEASTSWKSPYSVDSSSLSISSTEATAKAAVKSSLYPDVKFSLEVRIHEDGVARVRMDEVDGLRKRYDEAASWALVSEPKISQTISWTAGKKNLRAVYGEKKEIEVVVQYEPLRVSMLRNGKEQVVLNGQGLLHMEHFRNKEEPKEENQGRRRGGFRPVWRSSCHTNPRQKTENPGAWFEGESEDAFWEETFSSWTDSKPK